MPNDKVKIEASWKNELEEEFTKPYFTEIKQHLIADKKNQISIYPPARQIYNAFNFTPFDKIKIVILGQDPYHRNGQAHGLCFSVQDGIKSPPSLVNIFKELKNDVTGFEMPTHGNLTKWTAQGVFLLNAILTVKANQPASHQKIGWQNFTDAVISKISEKKEGVIFMLWGNFAKRKIQLIDESKHYVLKAAHPSPFSAYNGFFGCKHFSKANAILKSRNEQQIDWKI